MTTRHMVPIYDRVNKERLLGFHTHRFSIGRDHEFYRVATCHTPNLWIKAEMPDELSVDYVTFEFAWRPSKDGWTAERVLLTDNSLETLAKVRDFRFPGEHEDSAHFRQHY